MGRALALLALVVAGCGCGGCGGRDHDRGSPEGAAIPDPDERCDATKERVCVGGSVVACDRGVLGRRLRTCHDGCKDGRCVAVCPEGNELIYVVDRDDNLIAFDPRKLPADPLRLIGKLGCHGAGGPFSMAVDRHGVAWVLYSGGELFKVSITDATCERAPYQPGRLGLFGMGYASDAPGAPTEHLYVATNGRRLLASIDTEAASPSDRILGEMTAPSDESPELTGTRDGKLYGFYPNLSTPSFVQEVDRRSGEPVGPRWQLDGDPLGTVSAWAFAQWGGTFYVFVTGDDGLGSSVRAIDRKTGTSRTVLEHLPYVITGAGVSTCAPEKDQ